MSRRGASRRKSAFPEAHVHERVGDLAVLDHVATEAGLQFVAGFFEYARRSRIPGKDRGLNALEVEVVEGARRGFAQTESSDAASPERLGDPIADLGGEPVDIAIALEADAANALAVALD